MYFIGGLEPHASDKTEVLTIDGTTYVVSGKFKSMLRNLIIDWGTFLEVYNDNKEYREMFDQIVRILNIKENTVINTQMLDIIKKIYHLPASAHMASMMKQFMLYEPISIAIHAIFNQIKHHYEYIVKLFVESRNDYIAQHNIASSKNNWKKLIKYWDQMNEEHQLDSSSVILLFLNPPNGIRSKLHISIPKVDTGKLSSAISAFHYPGFCPRVPHKRLAQLLKFPINEFVNVIKQINPDATFPAYAKIEKFMVHALSHMEQKPDIADIRERESPPKDLVARSSQKKSIDELTDSELRARLDLAKWYVKQILEFRKKLVKTGEKYESYYKKIAEKLNTINVQLKQELPVL